MHHVLSTHSDIAPTSNSLTRRSLPPPTMSVASGHEPPSFRKFILEPRFWSEIACQSPCASLDRLINPLASDDDSNPILLETRPASFPKPLFWNAASTAVPATFSISLIFFFCRRSLDCCAPLQLCFTSVLGPFKPLLRRSRFPSLSADLSMNLP